MVTVDPKLLNGLTQFSDRAGYVSDVNGAIAAANPPRIHWYYLTGVNYGQISSYIPVRLASLLPPR